MTTHRFTYSGTVPGAVSTESVLFSTIAAGLAANDFTSYGIARIKTTVNHVAAGTFKWYRSPDRGVTWIQDGSQASQIEASGPSMVDVLVEGARDWKLTWTNGWTSQAAVITGNVAINGGGIPAAVASKYFDIIVDEVSYRIQFASPADEAATLAAINAVLGTAATATVDGSHYLVVTSAILGRMSLIQIVAGTLALATIGFSTNTQGAQAIGWAVTIDATTERHPVG